MKKRNLVSVSQQKKKQQKTVECSSRKCWNELNQGRNATDENMFSMKTNNCSRMFPPEEKHWSPCMNELCTVVMEEQSEEDRRVGCG